MRYHLLRTVLVAAALMGGCTTRADIPATAPPTTSRVSTTTATTMPPTTSTTIDRTAEIAAIFEDLERRRLDAIQNQDEVAFRELYANDQYGELELESLSRVVVRDADAVLVSNFDVLAEVDGCIAFHAVVDLRLAIEGGSESEFVAVIERTDTGWGYSWIGSGWTCSGPHPLSS